MRFSRAGTGREVMPSGSALTARATMEPPRRFAQYARKTSLEVRTVRTTSGLQMEKTENAGCVVMKKTRMVCGSVRSVAR